MIHFCFLSLFSMDWGGIKHTAQLAWHLASNKIMVVKSPWCGSATYQQSQEINVKVSLKKTE